MRLEYNFSNQHLELIRSSPDTGFTFDPTPHHTGIMGSDTGDYIRMAVLDEDETFIRSFYSNLSKDDTEIIYTPGADTTYPVPDTAVIVNPSGVDLNLEPYPISIDADSLTQYCIAIGYTGEYVPETVISTTTDIMHYYQYPFLGEELLTAGDFEGIEQLEEVGPEFDNCPDCIWNTEEFWSISGGEAILTDSGGTGYQLEQFSAIPVPGTEYKITYEIMSITPDDPSQTLGVYAQIGGTNGTVNTTPGIYTEDLTAGINLEFKMISSGEWNGNIHIDNITVKEVIELDWQLVEGTASVATSVECIATTTSIGYSIDWTTDGLEPQLRVYKDASGNLYVKPNEALEFGNINEGNYQLQFDFLHNPFYVFDSASTTEKYYFYITEISPSRKEVRLIARDGTDQQISITEDMIGELQPNGDYQYDFVLALLTGQNIPILNYMADLVSDPPNSSLILKLYFPLPTEIARLANVTIEQELITTQIENIWYKTEAYIESIYGYGLGNIIAEGGGLYDDI